MDLFARIAVSRLPEAIAWGDALFGPVEAFAPNDTEHVWTLAEHCHVYVELTSTSSSCRSTPDTPR
ncbi:hypothetical protein [Tsukamurella strandjordii]|uniref:hypothetical protein n=1 Tax=Tsukamurella strandjordii TaxID=147577 RepID=UPI0031D6FCC5